MVKVSDCSCCECDDKAKKQQIEERALSSVNKIYTFDARTYWPDGTGMVTIPLPTQDQLNKIEEVGTLADTVAADTARIDVTEADIAAIKSGYQKLAEKGSANGYAGLDNNGRVALANLYTGTSANQVPIIGKQLLANEMLVVDADGHTIRSKPVTQTLSFRGIYATKSALPSEGNVSGDYAVVSDGTAQADTGYYVWGYNTATTEYEWVWTILFDANNYQLISNLQTAIGSDADDSHYPSSKAAKNYVDAVAGTLQQDVDTLETDMASVQTTIGEHTTGIANAITQAQAGYQSASVDGSNLVLTKGNGEADSVELPGGGDAWIDIPLDGDWPTFKTRDRIRLWVAGTDYLYSPDEANWTSSISYSPSLNSSNIATVIEFEFIVSGSASTPRIPISIYSDGKSVRILTLVLGPLASWNAGSIGGLAPLINALCIAFNAKSCKTNSTEIRQSNISNLVKKMQYIPS